MIIIGVHKKGMESVFVVYIIPHIIMVKQNNLGTKIDEKTENVLNNSLMIFFNPSFNGYI